MTSLPTSTGDPEESFLIAFLHESTLQLNRCRIVEPMRSLEEIRERLLQIQTECLEAAVVRHNSEAQKLHQHHESSSLTQSMTLERAQDRLRSLGRIPTCTGSNYSPIRMAVEEMNDAARLAFCRLALYSECLLEALNFGGGKCKSCPKHHQSSCESNNYSDQNRPIPLKRSGRMEREDVLEFIGLCDAAVRLNEVQRYVSAGNSSASSGQLFPDIPLPDSSSTSYVLATSILPQDRLEYVQRLLLQAMGYDPVHGHGEIRRIFFDGARQRGSNNEFSHDTELMDRFVAMSAHMDAALTQATLRATLEAFGGGETNVRFVPTTSAFGSSNVDGCKVPADDEAFSSVSATPTSRTEPSAQNSLPLQPSAKLHQVILGELMMMDEEERLELLDEASRAEQERVYRLASNHAWNGGEGDVTQCAMPEEDEKTHRLLLSGRVWNSIISQNGGLPPKFR